VAYSQPVLEVPLCHLLPRPATKWYATFYATLRRQPTIRPENSQLERSYSGSFLRRVPHRLAWSRMCGVSQAASFGKSGSSAAKIVLAFSIAFFALASEASATPP
jgi:hypothetical protein